MKSIEGEETAEIPAKKMVLLPTECWADTFKFLSRRDLLRSVQPVDKRFHEIAEKRVDNVHVVRNFTSFFDKLEDKEVLRQLMVDIEGSEASLAKHFKLADQINSDLTKNLFGLKANELHSLRHSVLMCVLRNSVELFRGCNLILSMGILDPSPFVPILSLFQAARPWHIGIAIFNKQSQTWCLSVRWVRLFMNPSELLDNPTVLNCMRLTFVNFNVSNFAEVGNLLEHLPSSGEDDPNMTTAERTRVIIMWNVGRNFCSKLIERCKENLLKAKEVADVRRFLVLFKTPNFADVELEPFRLDHSATGEVLRLEQVPVGHDHFLGYVLRRCPAGDLATSDQFYRDTFTPHWMFKSPVQQDGTEPSYMAFLKLDD